MARRREPSDRSHLRPVPHVAGRTPPHDLDAEAAVLGAAIMSPLALETARAAIGPEHFFSDDNGRIFSAACVVADEGRPVDLVTVVGKLRDLGLAQRVGGPAYVAQLVDRTPALANVAEHAAIVLAKWRSRSFISTCHASIAEAYDADPIALATVHAAAIEQLAAGRCAVPSLADQVRGMLAAPLPRVSTGVAALDIATRGGVPTGRVMVLAGAPGAGKTTFAVQLAYDSALRGMPVAFHAADESGEGIRIRFGQLSGLNRDDLEKRDPLALEHLAGIVSTDLASLVLCDQEEHGQTLEDVALALARRARGGPALLVADSLQKIVVSGTLQAENPRARVAVEACVRIAKRHRFLVVVTSEVARGFYRGGDEREPNALAAGKDSGSIEFGADLQLVLRSVPDGAGDVDVDVPKNRLGSDKPTFRMRIDHHRARMSPLETALPKAPAKGDVAGARLAQHEAAVKKMRDAVVLAVIRAKTPITSRANLRRLVAGKGDVIETAITRLFDEGRLVRSVDAARHKGVEIRLAEDPLPSSGSTPGSTPRSTPQGGAQGLDPLPLGPSTPPTESGSEGPGSGSPARSANGLNGTHHEDPLPDPLPEDPLPDPLPGAS
jgi:KaiC/GvpD/RAD55 family RecA-like ATPase